MKITIKKYLKGLPTKQQEVLDTILSKATDNTLTVSKLTDLGCGYTVAGPIGKIVLKLVAKGVLETDGRAKPKPYVKRSKSRTKHLQFERGSPEYMRAARIKSTYGLSTDQYKSMLDEQAHKCAICGVSASDLSQNLCIDHCHDTGNTRGLLCRECNSGIGKLKDDIGLITKALEYLIKYKTNDNRDNQKGL